MKTQASKANTAPILAYVTLTNGRTSYTSRSDVPESRIESMVDAIQSAEPVHLPPQVPGIRYPLLHLKTQLDSRYTALLLKEGTNLLTKLHHKVFGTVVTFGTALDSDEGLKLWKFLGGEGKQPPVPWCAVKFEPGMLYAAVNQSEDVLWYMEFEREVAWGWHAIAAKK